MIVEGIATYVTLGASAATLVTAIAAWRSIALVNQQMETAERYKRADLINELTRAFYDDDDLVDHFMRLSYDPLFRFDLAQFEAAHHRGSAAANAATDAPSSVVPEAAPGDEPWFDDRQTAELLDLLNTVCYYIDQRMLSREAVAGCVLGYLIARCWKHGAIQQYLEWVDQPTPGAKRQLGAFAHFREHAPGIVFLKYPG